MTRSEEREQAFILVFEKIFNTELSFSQIIELANDSDLFEQSDFSELLFKTVCENTEKTDALISENLRGWTIGRIPKVCLALLRLAVTEIMFFDDIPDSATANEAVELAKKYASSEDASFINGVLGSVIRGK